MAPKLLSGEIRDGLAACDNIRAMSGPLNSDRVEHELEKVEKLLRHLLNIVAETQHVDRSANLGEN